MNLPHAELGRAPAHEQPAKKSRVTPGEWVAFSVGGLVGCELAELARRASGPGWVDRVGGLFAIAGGVSGVAAFPAVKSRNVYN